MLEPECSLGEVRFFWGRRGHLLWTRNARVAVIVQKFAQHMDEIQILSKMFDFGKKL